LFLHNGVERFGSAISSEFVRAGGKDRVFTVFNGPVNASGLQRKDRFGSTISDLGYLAPRSVTVNRGDDLDAALPSIIRLDSTSELRFCKPVGGERGIGAKLVGSPQEVITYLRSAPLRYRRFVVQCAHVAVQEWRYIAHRDAAGILAGEPHQWRITYEKVRPFVTGDGSSSVRSLVERHPEMPERSRQKYFASHAEDDPERILGPGQELVLAETANARLGIYLRFPDSREACYLDTFMTRFLADLEQRMFQPYGYGTSVSISASWNRTCSISPTITPQPAVRSYSTSTSCYLL
jgi:hypothetical protein